MRESDKHIKGCNMKYTHKIYIITDIENVHDVHVGCGTT